MFILQCLQQCLLLLQYFVFFNRQVSLGFVCISCGSIQRNLNFGLLSSARRSVVCLARHTSLEKRKRKKLMSFHLTLPSGSSQRFFPNNTISSYTTKLAKSINLEGDYEVGISSIHFPLTYYNVQKDEFKIYFVKEEDIRDGETFHDEDKKTKVYSIPEGRHPHREWLMKCSDEFHLDILMFP